MSNPTWDFEKESDKLLAIGTPNGTVDLDTVILSRRARKEEIFGRLELAPADRVLDLGSGMGFIAEFVAPEVRWLYCADISASYVSECRARLARLSNVTVQKIEYADLSPFNDCEIDKAYSTLVFIHFNFYDLFFYLTELNKTLKLGGKLYFDYNDGERFSLAENGDSFHSHLRQYKEHRESWIFGCMHMNSYAVLCNLAPQLGFEIQSNWTSGTSFSHILLKKVRHLS
jgi:cyclopropane fatty-acyl-phospholipid synthase-like methyltransferase